VSHFFLFQYLYLNYTVPIQNYFDSAKFFYVKVSKIVKTSEPLAYFSDNENYTFTFYARRPITTIKTHEALTGYMSASEKKYAVLSEKHLKFYPKQPWNIKLIGEFSEHRSWGKYFLLCNQ
jgi:ubiquinone biosynthesis protein COQ9